MSAEDDRQTVLRELDSRFPGLPNPLREFIADQPAALEVLIRFQALLDTAGWTPADVVRLVTKWVDALPPERGRVVRLSDRRQDDLFSARAVAYPDNDRTRKRP